MMIIGMAGTAEQAIGWPVLQVAGRFTAACRSPAASAGAYVFCALAPEREPWLPLRHWPWSWSNAAAPTRSGANVSW